MYPVPLTLNAATISSSVTEPASQIPSYPRFMSTEIRTDCRILGSSALALYGRAVPFSSLSPDTALSQ